MVYGKTLEGPAGFADSLSSPISPWKSIGQETDSRETDRCRHWLLWSIGPKEGPTAPTQMVFGSARGPGTTRPSGGKRGVHRSPRTRERSYSSMKSLMLNVAFVASLGLCSAALADGGCGQPACGQPACGQPACGCGGHGLLSWLRLHRGCCEQPAPCAAPCDSCCGHRLSGLFRHGCCEAPKPACAPCAPKCCAPKCESPCNPCGGHNLFGMLRGLHGGCGCEAKPACNACDSCGHGSIFGRLLSHRCGGCGSPCSTCGGAVEAAPGGAPSPMSPAPAPAPAPKPMGATSNGLLILTPAG